VATGGTAVDPVAEVDHLSVATRERGEGE